MGIDEGFVIDRAMMDGRSDVRESDVPICPELAAQLGGLKRGLLREVEFGARHNGDNSLPITLGVGKGLKAYSKNAGFNNADDAEPRADRYLDRMKQVCNILADEISRRIVVSTRDHMPYGSMFDALVNHGRTFVSFYIETLADFGIAVRPENNATLKMWLDNKLGRFLTERLRKVNIEGQYPFADNEFSLKTETDINSVDDSGPIILKIERN